MRGDVWAFDRFARFYDLFMPRANRETLARGLDVATRPVERVLDVGGGSGRAVRTLDARLRVVADPARGMLRRARRRDLQGVQSDGACLPVRTASVDAVLVVDALHHVEDQVGTLAEAARVLRPGGVLVVREFDPTTLRGRALVAAEHLLGFDSVFRGPGRLAEMVGEAGLTARIVDSGFGYTVAGHAADGIASESGSSKSEATH